MHVHGFAWKWGLVKNLRKKTDFFRVGLIWISHWFLKCLQQAATTERGIRRARSITTR